MDRSAADILWILISAGLVLLMQAGFLAIESGLTRSKNSINVAIKNITDFGVAAIFFWVAGFALMFGTSVAGLFGSDHFFLSWSPSDMWTPAFFVFQLAFAGTSATIVSGAVAERFRFQAYIITTALISCVIYPLAGHWAWGSAYGPATPGWLESLGFVDFAGSTIVHSVGGWVSLAALLVTGPRSGRFVEGQPPRIINGSNLPMAMLGGIILWVGWVGFNGGSTLALDMRIAGIIANTVLALGAGLVTSLLLTWLRLGFAEATAPLNGSLAGLVAVTAGAHALSPVSALFVGAVAGLLVMPTISLLERLRIDDAVGAVPVHLISGIWGTLAVGLFGDAAALGTGLGRLEQIAVQLTGIVAIGIWAFGFSYLLLKGIDRFFPLRVTLEDEKAGLNISEHRASTDLVDLLVVMEQQKHSGDLSSDVPVEPFTEVGQIAEMYNSVLHRVRSTLQENEEARLEIGKAYEKAQEEHKRAESLLLNILPPTIAEQLKSRSGIIANSFSSATVLFADIVGFTQLASKYSPEVLVRMLNRIFSAFDATLDRLGLEKIKTIGDSYMAVAGLPNERPDHAAVVVEFALRIQEIMKKFRFRDDSIIEMRVGISSGPVVAGIIGTKRFIYDLWGETVNLASRMESAGLPGEVQISEETARLLENRFAIEERGLLDLKGIGERRAFLVRGRREG